MPFRAPREGGLLSRPLIVMFMTSRFSMATPGGQVGVDDRGRGRQSPAKVNGVTQPLKAVSGEPQGGRRRTGDETAGLFGMALLTVAAYLGPITAAGGRRPGKAGGQVK